MHRPTRRKARPGAAILATAAVLAGVLAPAPSLAAEAATDEYVLEYPGAPQSSSTSPAGTASDTGGGGGDEQRGVVGEAEHPESGLASLISTVGAAPAALLVALAALIGLLAAGWLSSRPAVREAR